MAVKVTSNIRNRLFLPYPISAYIEGRREKTFEYVAYDDVINNAELLDLINRRVISVLNLEGGGAYGSTWNSPDKFHLGNYHVWVDSLGRMRIKNGDATSDFDGAEVGAGAVGPHGTTHTILGSDPIPNLETLEDIYTCTATEAVLDLVYESASNTCAQANASGIATMPAIGVVLVKPAPIQCVVARAGEVTGYVGLTPDAPYFASTTPGGISLTPPSGSGQVVQKIGFAKDPTTLVVQIEEYVIRA